MTGDLEGLSTHDLVGKALLELGDQDTKDGIPKQDVVQWVTSRTELTSHDVRDAISWLHNNGHVYEPKKGRLRRTTTDADRWLAVAWHEALVEVHAKSGHHDPKYLADRYSAETPDEVGQLVDQAGKEVIRSGNDKLTLDDLDRAEEKLEGAGDHEVATDGGVDQSLTDTEWEFQEGETLVKEDASEPPTMPGLGGNLETEKTEYTVTHRLVDADEGRRYYNLEWEVDAQKGSISDKNTRTMLYSASLVRMHYRSLETDTDPNEGESA
ncbi:hypothetical protein [Natrinema thermotolerans]|uniref:hypothetical protein n=1 Tax=Natrinema thermotolerans TaxID=121872 RepID=UPI0006799359|nr:hypothetical protein [Natrinema thermotolerans]QCC57337.1 hypothetical protein DVR14_01260 [Natrinema thermotolerans]